MTNKFCCSSPSSRHGFTLIEVAVVLVVVGLLIGGVLVGQSLIRSAQIRNVIAAIDTYTTSVNAFKTKYGALPGDMANAGEVWGLKTADTATCWSTAPTSGSPLTCNGNGDGKINNRGGGQGYEYFWVWQHLYNAGMTDGGYFSGIQYTDATCTATATYSTTKPGVNVPDMKLNGAGLLLQYMGIVSAAGVVFPGDFGHIFVIGASNTSVAGNCANANYYPAMTGEDAQTIDSRIDDGLPGTGKVVTITPTAMASNSCITTTDQYTSRYATSTANIYCALAVVSGF